MGDLPNGAAVKNLVEELVMVPRSYASIVRTVEPFLAEWPPEARFTKHSVARHAHRHLKWEAAALREIADRRTSQLEQVDATSQRMLDATVVLETIRQRGLDLLLQDEIRPSVKDLLAATDALQELEDEADGTVTPAIFHSQVNRIIEVIRDEVPEDRWEYVVARLEGRAGSSVGPTETDPVFEELMREVDQTD